MIRLGIAGRILGRAGQLAQGARRSAHLSLGLIGLRDTLLYLVRQDVAYYRLAADLLSPDLSLQERLAQIDTCHDLLAEVGAAAQANSIRLTLHLGLHITLSAPDDAIAARAAAEIVAQAALLDALGSGPEGVLVLHVGGAHRDGATAVHRFATRFERLPAAARRRLAVELDEGCFTLPDLLRLHQYVGVPVVLDTLHLQMNNPQRLGLSEALGLAQSTWPRGVRPEVHFSTQRTEGHLLQERGAWRVAPPRHGQHADFANPFEFAGLVAAARGLAPFDVLLEAKAGDLAVLRLRDDLRRFAPEVAAMVQ